MSHPDGSQEPSKRLVDDLTPTKGDGVFRTHAKSYLEIGIVALPCDGKKPKVRRPDKFGKKAIQKLLDDGKVDAESIGVWCGARTGLTIVDVDIPTQQALTDALNRFGDTPLIVQTASGKWHLYYRNNGEKRQHRIGGEAIDILGDGIAILPNSRTDKGKYRFHRGDMQTLKDRHLLPTIKHGAIAKTANGQVGVPSKCNLSGKILSPLVTKEGERNRTLFDACLQEAGRATGIEELAAFALRLNGTFLPPLSEAEVKGVVSSVWTYKTNGKLRPKGGEPVALLPVSLIKSLARYPLEFQILASARAHHGSELKKEFSLGVRALAKVYGKSTSTISKAIKRLIELGHIERVTIGGNGPGTPSTYRLVTEADKYLPERRI